MRMVLVTLALLCCTVGLALAQGRWRLGQDKQVTVNAKQALSLAEKYLHEDGVADAGYQSQIALLNDPDNSECVNVAICF